jgi:menaquinone-dependent protoporphyrinogen oxidase
MNATRVLVSYATAQGSTTGVAERVADVLTDAGLDVLCRPAAPHLDPAAFDAVVVGSAVHNMAWLPPAADLLRRAAASGRPIWCFSVGGVNPRGPVSTFIAGHEATRVARGFPGGFRARDHRVFGGIVQMAGVPLWGRLFWRLMGGRPGDHRNWPAIESWARAIATELTRSGTPTADRSPAPRSPA